MVARLITAQVQYNCFDEAGRLYREGLLPAARQQPGFAGGWFLLNPATGKGLIILLWAGQAELKAGEAGAGFQKQFRQLAACFVGLPERETYQVSL